MKYSGKTNPSDFIVEFLDMAYYANNVGLRVHLLHQSVDGAAKAWLNKQSRELLDNFPELIRKFEKYFINQAKFVPTMHDLNNIKIKSDEELVAFIDR